MQFSTGIPMGKTGPFFPVKSAHSWLFLLVNVGPGTRTWSGPSRSACGGCGEGALPDLAGVGLPVGAGGDDAGVVEDVGAGAGSGAGDVGVGVGAEFEVGA